MKGAEQFGFPPPDPTLAQTDRILGTSRRTHYVLIASGPARRPAPGAAHVDPPLPGSVPHRRDELLARARDLVCRRK